MSLITINGTIDGQDIEDNFANIISGALMHYNTTWTAYTPAWSTGGTAPSIGNGTLRGRYIKIGRFVYGQIFFQAGSTTTFGTGSWFFTLPVNNSTVYYDDEHHPVGNVYLEDYSTVGYNGFARIMTTQQNKLSVHALTANTTFVNDAGCSGTVPFTWATNDFLSAWFMYESEE